jgi:hypothetical protein
MKRFLEWINKQSGTELYHAADPRAQWVKALIQMIIGMGTVIAIAILVWFPALRHGGIAELSLHVVAAGLALAAVVELTYTLFTEGPDEALDPLILGMSSFILLNISDPGTDLTINNAGTIALLVLALGGLFVIREQFIEKPKREREKALEITPTAEVDHELTPEKSQDPVPNQKLPGTDPSDHAEAA